MRLSCAFYGLLFLGLPALSPGQSAPSNACQPSPQIQAAIRETGKSEIAGDGQPQDAIKARQERQGRFKELFARYPDDFWVSRAYIDAMKYGVAPDDVIADFKSRHDANPESSQAAYLYARALTGKDTRKAITILTSTASSVPSFPWSFADLENIYSSPNFRDSGKRNENGETFIRLCPDASEGATIATRLDKSDTVVAFAQALRQRIAGKADPDTLFLYRTLWTLEFKLTPLSEHGPLRERVAEDLRFLSTLDSQEFKSLKSVLGEGYKLTGNKQAEDELTGTAAPENKMRTFFDAQEAWEKANPRPREGEPEKLKAYNDKKIRMLDEWIAQLPDQDFLRVQRLRIIARTPDTPDPVVVSEGEKVIEVTRKRSSTVISFPSPLIDVADIWANRGLELDRIPALVEEGIELTKKEQLRNGAARSDLYDSPGTRLMDENNLWQTDHAAWQTLVTAYTKMGRMDEVRSVLAQWEKGLRQLRNSVEEFRKSQESDKSVSGRDRGNNMGEMVLRNLPFAESSYATAMAEFALADHRKLDALAFYQSGLHAMNAAGSSVNATNSDMARKASNLWKELGGTPEGWQAWLDSLREVSPAKLPEMSRWAAMNRKLPELNLSDQTGKTWTLARIKGRTTLINVWATWCGPCRSELPSLQKLYEKVKEREDVQVITFNMDENTGLVAPFLAENKYTFPVLIAKSFMDDFGGPMGIPTNWISDRNGSLRLEATGFGGDGDEWLKNTFEQMEKIRGGASK